MKKYEIKIVETINIFYLEKSNETYEYNFI